MVMEKNRSLPESAEIQYKFEAERFQELCDLRDKLLDFSASAMRFAAQQPEMLACCSALAHCFESMGHKLGNVLNTVSAEPVDPAQQVDGPESTRVH